MLKVIISTLFLNICISSLCYADCHRVQAIQAAQVVQKVYHTPQYQQAYANAYNQQIVAPYAIPVAIVPNTFYQVLPELAYARINQEIADTAAEKAAKRAVQEFIQQLKLPAPGQPEQPKESLKNPKDAEVFSKVSGMVKEKCVRCHGKGTDLDLTDINKLDRNQRLEMVHRIMTDDPNLKMPKGNGSVSSAELDATHLFVMAAPKVVKNKEELPKTPLPKEDGLRLLPKEESKEVPKEIPKAEKSKD